MQHVLQPPTGSIGGHRLPIAFQLIRRHHVRAARCHQPARVQLHVIDRALDLMCGSMLGLVRRLVRGESNVTVHSEGLERLEPLWQRVHKCRHRFPDLFVEDRLVRRPVVLRIVSFQTCEELGRPRREAPYLYISHAYDPIVSHAAEHPDLPRCSIRCRSLSNRAWPVQGETWLAGARSRIVSSGLNSAARGESSSGEPICSSLRVFRSSAQRWPTAPYTAPTLPSTTSSLTVTITR